MMYRNPLTRLTTKAVRQAIRAGAAAAGVNPAATDSSLKAHVPGCPLGPVVGRPKPTCTGTGSRRLSLHRREHTLRAAAPAVESEPETALESTPSTSYSNGSGSKEDLTYAMDYASNDVLYKRFFELLDGKWGDVQEGDKIQGVILTVEDRGSYVELGRKGPAYCHSHEMTTAKGVKAHEIVAPNQVRDFVVTDVFSDGDVLVSMLEVELSVTWARLVQLQEEGVAVLAKGISVGPNGLIVDVMGISGFLPKRFADRNAALDDLVDQEFYVKILEANEENDRMIVAQKMMAPGSAESDFKVGDVLEGKIVSLQPYGAFVNCGGMNDGLLHVSQISHDRVTNLEAVFSVGDSIKVMVLTHEKERGRINLSTKKLEPNPGDMLRNPQKVFDQADKMAAAFREQMKQAQELELRQGGESSMDASIDA